MTFKGDFFDITLEGESGKDVVMGFLRTKEEIEAALKSYDSGKAAHGPSRQTPKGRISPYQAQPLQDLSLRDLTIPDAIKDAFVERKSDLSNWNTIFLLLHYHTIGLSNKQLRSLSEELGKPIKFSWFDSEFHRRDNEGLVVSKRIPGRKEALYFLTEPGKKEAEKLTRALQTEKQ